MHASVYAIDEQKTKSITTPGWMTAGAHSNRLFGLGGAVPARLILPRSSTLSRSPFALHAAAQIQSTSPPVAWRRKARSQRGFGFHPSLEDRRSDW